MVDKNVNKVNNIYLISIYSTLPFKKNSGAEPILRLLALNTSSSLAYFRLTDNELNLSDSRLIQCLNAIDRIIQDSDEMQLTKGISKTLERPIAGMFDRASGELSYSTTILLLKYETVKKLSLSSLYEQLYEVLGGSQHIPKILKEIPTNKTMSGWNPLA